MFSVLVGMAVIILAGVCWRFILGDKDAERIRSHLALAVYHIFLPALVLHVLWRTQVDMNTVRIPLVSALSVLLSLLAAFLVYGDGRLVRGGHGAANAKRAVGALLLASAFGNFTYLGLPVLTQTFGPWSQFVAIQFDLLASTPLLFTVGIMLARYYGTGGAMHPLLALLRVPALWAAIVGLFLSAAAIAMPAWADASLKTLRAAVVPLMLLSIGMALRWRAGWIVRIPVLLPALAIQLLLMPLIAWASAIGVGLSDRLLAPVVIEGAMPSMVLGLVICDRFKLDASLYAEAVTLSTVLSLLTLPLWLRALA